MSIFLKVSNCRIIIAQTTYFENIQYCKIYFHYILGFYVWLKLVTMTLLPSFGRDFHFKFEFFKKCLFFSIFILPHIKAQTTYFENIKYCKIYFQYGLGLVKTKYNDSVSFFWKIFLFQISFFFKNVHFSWNFQIAA